LTVLVDYFKDEIEVLADKIIFQGCQVPGSKS